MLTHVGLPSLNQAPARFSLVHDDEVSHLSIMPVRWHSPGRTLCPCTEPILAPSCWRHMVCTQN